MRREDAERLLHHHYRLHTQVKSQIDNKPPKSMFVSPKSVHYKTFTNRVTRPKSLDNLVKGQTKRSGQDELVQFVNRPQVASVTNSLPSQSGSFNVYVRRSMTNVAQFLPSTASTSAASLRPTTLKRSLFDSSRIRAKILDDRNYAPPLRRSGPPSTIALDKSFRRLAIQSSNVSQKSTTSHEKVPNTSGKLRMVQCMMRARTASTNTARRKLLSASENVSDQAKNVMAVTLGKEYQDFKDTVLSNIIRRGVFNDRVIKNSFYKEIERRRDLDLNQMEIIMFDTLAELNVKIVETLPPPPPSRALRPLTAKPRKVTIANPKRLIESDEGDSDLSIANDDEKGEDSSSKSSTTSSSKTESNSDSKSDGDTPRAMSPNIRSINSSSSQLDDDSKSDNNRC